MISIHLRFCYRIFRQLLVIGHWSFSISFALLLSCAYLPSETFASSFAVDPSISAIYKSNFPISRTISLRNLSSTTENIHTQIMAINQDSNGQAEFLSNSQTDPQTKLLLKHISLSPTSLSLLPQESKNLQVSISSDSAILLNKDYYFSVLFISKDIYSLPLSDNQVKATLLQEPVIASLFLVSLTPAEKNSLHAQLLIASPSWSTVLYPRLKIDNKSNSLVQLTIHTTVTDFLGGKYIGQYKTNNYLFNHNSRVISLGPASLPFSFFGPATISVIISDAHSGMSVHSTQRILIIPIAFWAGLLVSLSCIIFFIKRVKTRLAKQRHQD